MHDGNGPSQADRGPSEGAAERYDAALRELNEADSEEEAAYHAYDTATGPDVEPAREAWEKAADRYDAAWTALFGDGT